MDDNIYGPSGKALQLCEQRAALLTHNIANSSTPHYKARDIDFHKLLEQTNSDNKALLTTNSMHLNPVNTLTGDPLYRVPMQMSLDGNTVDEEIERKSFIENAMRYQVNLTFVQSKTEQLMKAVKGE